MKKSTGIVSAVNGLIFSLIHTLSETPITVTVLAGGSIASFSDNIPVDEEGEEPVPKPTLKPAVNASVSGTYTYTEEPDPIFGASGSGTITFSGGTSGTVSFSFTISMFGQTETTRANGTYTVTGNTIIITITSVEQGSDDPFFDIKPGDTETFTIIDENTIRDNEGEDWKKR